jgi:hypothetical protein
MMERIKTKRKPIRYRAQGSQNHVTLHFGRLGRTLPIESTAYNDFVLQSVA